MVLEEQRLDQSLWSQSIEPINQVRALFVRPGLFLLGADLPDLWASDRPLCFRPHFLYLQATRSDGGSPTSSEPPQEKAAT